MMEIVPITVFRRFLCLLIALMCSLAAEGEETGEFRVKNAATTLVDGVYQLQAHIAITLSDEVLQALESGVPITLVLDMDVGRRRHFFLWNEPVASLEQRYRLAFHSLTEQYQVMNLNTAAQDTYPDLAHALHAIGEVDNFPMLDRRLLNTRERYDVELRVRLDIESLPSPLRLVAYISHGWRLASPWYVLPLNMGASP